jgi:predicted Rossmann fold flavoprotein
MRIGIIGGGPAGFFGAISAAKVNPNAQITILESTQQPLEKVLLSGGGRCNVTHSCFDPKELVRNYPRGFKELIGPFNSFQPRDTMEWFNKHGVKLKTEPDGRIFPVTDSSSTIVDCLLNSTREAGITVKIGERVKQITHDQSEAHRGAFAIESFDGTVARYNRVLIATGSSHQGYRFAESLGHTIVPPVPSLFTFKIAETALRELSGISFEDVALTLLDKSTKLLDQRGPLLITHWGLSGPAVLKLSAWGARLLSERHYHADLLVNFFPDIPGDEIVSLLRKYKEVHGKRRLVTECPFELPKRYWSFILNRIAAPDDLIWSYLTKEQFAAICTEVNSAHFAVSGKGIFKEEFVTCGGVALNEVDFRTMQSKRCNGLYFAGEILDIDGITGGFNFQSAWTTGWIAGQKMGGGGL